jgi:hypothetical protein
MSIVDPRRSWILVVSDEDDEAAYAPFHEIALSRTS